MEAWKHVQAIVLLPGMVLDVISATIIYLNGIDIFSLWKSVPAIRFILPVIAVGFVVAALALVFLTFWQFGTSGPGTLSSWNPRQRLVVRRVYHHVRTPMISGVRSILLGETLLTASLPLFCWFVFFVTVNMIYIPLAEEPGLVKRCGEDYIAYHRNVPRWIRRSGRP